MSIGLIGRILGMSLLAFFFYSALFIPTLVTFLIVVFLIALFLSLGLKYFHT